MSSGWPSAAADECGLCLNALQHSGNPTESDLYAALALGPRIQFTIYRCNVVITKGTCCHPITTHTGIISCLIHTYGINIFSKCYSYSVSALHNLGIGQLPETILCGGYRVWPCETTSVYASVYLYQW